jgi:hypothetical protein
MSSPYDSQNQKIVKDILKSEDFCTQIQATLEGGISSQPSPPIDYNRVHQVVKGKTLEIHYQGQNFSALTVAVCTVLRIWHQRDAALPLDQASIKHLGSDTFFKRAQKSDWYSAIERCANAVGYTMNPQDTHTMSTPNTASAPRHPVTPLSKPFILLAGISGTGKTRFVREQAKATGLLNQTYRLISVRPDWHEPSDLLGYLSRLNQPTEYITTEVLWFIAQAWRRLVDQGLTLKNIEIAELGERWVTQGDRTQLNTIPPYWLCLDEMNLAPVEQYFADYLSVLETREWRWQNNQFQYFSDALLKASVIQQIGNPEKLRTDLGLTSRAYDELWALICQHGLGIPFNLIVAGTVNMDETTHGFSRKVIDRALTFDFGEFFPNEFDQFFTPKTANRAFSYPLHTHAQRSDFSSTCDTETFVKPSAAQVITR